MATSLGDGPAERELQRLARRCAGVLRVVVVVSTSVLALASTPTGPGIVAAAAVNVWSVGYFVLVTRNAGNWLLVADAVVVCAACAIQPWTVPPEILHGSASWPVGVASIAVAIWQWHSGMRAGGIATAAVVLAYLASAGLTSASVLVTAWLVAEAALSRGLYHLIRAGAREADRIMAEAEQTRRDATVAAARRADEREHLAAIHDTAAATVLAIGTGVVDGREPWLAEQVANALNEITADATTTHGEADLVPLLADVLRNSPVRAELSTATLVGGGGSADHQMADPVPLPAVAAVAICRAVREALHNVARHAGVEVASVRLEHRAGHVVVEVVDSGRGFDPGAVPVHHRGIALSLVERMAAVGGRAGVTSSPGAGTRVRLEWPDG